ncbi:hypothetical protein SAMN05421505_107183 [Sinosporangium album]|uniref:Twin-arginine translocation pathway signal n=1 Tax=Sinosporangium album TaxID=504805 RepID=A0A1G7WTG3_9ACTN|nr:hypothetical protein [Sinosporangium album]SDG75199.1 hypothetical protein SAMN05421505_107183 [Sinosporangium album]
MDLQGRETITTELRARAAKESWSPWQLVQAVHQEAATPTLLMAWRLASGQVQTDVIAGVRGLATDEGHPCTDGAPSVQNYSKWENGHGGPGTFYRRYLALWFRCPLERLGLAEPEPIATLVGHAQVPVVLTDPEDPLERRQFLSLAAATPLISLEDTRSRMETGLRRVLPAADLEHWADVAAGHVAAYGTRPPGLLLTKLRPDLDEIAALAERYPHQTDLHLIASRLCGLVGALYTDLDFEREARDWLHTAGRYAHLSGDSTQRYWIAMAQAMTAFYGSAPARVIAITDRARATLGRTPSAPAAQLAGLAARAHAHLGAGDRAVAELDTAQTIFGKLTPGQTDEPFFGFPKAEMTMYSSQVLSRTGDARAWDEQDRALAAYPDDDPMDRPLILLDRARYVAGQGDSDQAAKIASDAITALPADLRVPLLVGQTRQVAALIARRSPHAATDLNDAVLAS